MSTQLPVIGTAHALLIEGEAARRFAQAQFSGDVDALPVRHWQWNAWLTSAGRVRALMQLADLGEGRLLAVVRGGDIDQVRRQLERFVLRSPVTLATQRCITRAGGPAPLGQAHQDGSSVVLGYGTRSLHLECSSELPAPDHAAASAWRLADIRAGWPWLPEVEPEFLPPALGLENLGAVAFEKGCYPGQEIAARLHFRGGHKRALFHLCGPVALPRGASRTCDGSEAWILDTARDAAGYEALAVLPKDTHTEISIMGEIFRVVSRFAS